MNSSFSCFRLGPLLFFLSFLSFPRIDRAPALLMTPETTDMDIPAQDPVPVKPLFVLDVLTSLLLASSSMLCVAFLSFWYVSSAASNIPGVVFLLPLPQNVDEVRPFVLRDRGGMTRFTATCVPRYSANSTIPKEPRPRTSGGSLNFNSSLDKRMLDVSTFGTAYEERDVFDIENPVLYNSPFLTCQTLSLDLRLCS